MRHILIDYPKYKIRREPKGQKSGLKEAWEKLKQLVASIKPDENYQCHKCNLSIYCKWCPGKGWLYNKSFTACDPESRRKAESNRRQLLN